MRILLTNDDGVNARGLELLESDRAQLQRRHLDRRAERGAIGRRPFADPDRRRCGCGSHDERRFSVTGTPTDAVMMALAHIMKDSPPDLILSGINRGANLAEDVTYSGTVSAAMEGALAGVRSIALSQAYSREGMGDTVPFAAAEAWAERVLAPLLEFDAAPRDADQRQFPGAAARRRQGHSRLPPGPARLRPAADRQAHRSARLRLLLVRAWADGRDAGPFDRPRGDRRRLCLGQPATPRPDARPVARRAARAVRGHPLGRSRDKFEIRGAA